LYWASNEGENRTWIEYIEAVMGPTSGAKWWESWKPIGSVEGKEELPRQVF